jgi:WD40 repeat protein
LAASPEIANARLTAVAFVRDTTLALGDAKGGIHLFNMNTRKVERSFSAHRGAVTCLAVAPDGKSFVSGGVDTTMLIWDLAALGGASSQSRAR